MNKLSMPLKYQILYALARFQKSPTTYTSYHQLTTDQHDGLAFNAFYCLPEKDVRKAISQLVKDDLIVLIGDKDHFLINGNGKAKLAEFETGVAELLFKIGLN